LNSSEEFRKYPQRAGAARPGRWYAFGPFRLDPLNRLLLRDGEALPLGPTVVETLLVLLENHGELVSKEEILKSVWPDTVVEESNLSHNISVLRKALGEAPGDQRYIQTISKRGYRFVADVREAESAAEPEPVEQARPNLALMPQSAPPLHRRLGPWTALGALVLVSVAAGLALWLSYSRRQSRPGADSNNLPVATFTKLTSQPGEELFPSLAPDGKSFVYSSRASGNWDIYLQRVGGSNPVNLTKDSPADDTQPAFSPGGELIAFRSERDGGGIFVMGATGESVRRVSNFGYSPAWSPDGKEIVCATAGLAAPEFRFARDSQLFAVSLASGEKRLISSKIDFGVQPQWSPHGYRIVYGSMGPMNTLASPPALGAPPAIGGAQREIWTVAALGGANPAPMVVDEHVNWGPVWSPGGKYLYFSSDRGGSMNVWRVAIDEESGKPLGPPEPVTTPSRYTGHLTFSRDGRRMAYVEQLASSNIQRVGFDAVRQTVVGRPTAVTQGSEEMIAPDVSPDGQWLAFVSWGKQEQIFVARTDGADVRQLTDGDSQKRLARWSPDGERISFYSNRTGKSQIWTIKRDGSDLRQLTYEARGGTGPAVWSPDGSRLAYCVSGYGVYILQTAKSWAEQSPEALPQTGNPSEWISAWSWSGDGRKLLVQHWRTVDGVTTGFSTYSLDSRKYERLTEIGDRPRWLKDNRRLLFHDRGKLWLMDTVSRKTREIFEVSPHEIGERFAISLDNRAIYFSRMAKEADIWLAEFNSR
jgi:Tol biopolymer transport system component/DNA-binding winged helix-turn-helix (wHTH) protein